MKKEKILNLTLLFVLVIAPIGTITYIVIKGDDPNKFINSLLTYIGIISTALIIIAISIRSVLDVASNMGLLPKWIDDFLHEKERDRTKKLLDELGILPRVKKYRALTNWLDNPQLVDNYTDQEVKDKLKEISKCNIDNESLTVGDVTNMRIEYYLNLRKAFCNGFDITLASLMASWIKNRAKEHDIVFDCIVSRKSGLDMLGYFVAKLLNVEYILYHDYPSINKVNLVGDKSKVIRSFEYLPEHCKHPIIVDDSCVSGNSILKMAEDLRIVSEEKEEIYAFVFFTRSEKTKPKLFENKVLLNFVEYYDDKSLEELFNNK